MDDIERSTVGVAIVLLLGIIVCMMAIDVWFWVVGAPPGDRTHAVAVCRTAAITSRRVEHQLAS